MTLPACATTLATGRDWLIRWFRSSRPLALSGRPDRRSVRIPSRTTTSHPLAPAPGVNGLPPAAAPAPPPMPPPPPPPTHLLPPTQPALMRPPVLPAVRRALKRGLPEPPPSDRRLGQADGAVGKTPQGSVPPTGSWKGSAATNNASLDPGHVLARPHQKARVQLTAVLAPNGPGPSRPPSTAQARLQAALAPGPDRGEALWADAPPARRQRLVTPAELAAAKERADRGLRVPTASSRL